MVAQVGAPVFAPPLDTPLLLRIEQVRDDAGVKRRFVTRRRIAFARDGDGFRATVTPLAGEASRGDPSGAMFEAMAQALSDRPIVFRLNRAGAIVVIEDQAALWDLIADAVGSRAVASRSAVGAERAALAARLSAPLRAMPADRQRQILGSMLAPTIAADVAGSGAIAPAPTTLAVQAIDGTPASIAATRAVVAEGDLLAVTLDGTGAHPGGAIVAMTSRRRIDPRTGLLRDAREQVSITLPGGAGRSIRTTTTTLLPDG